jgi:HTH-type transcriptional regulator, bacterioopsin transcriptional activator and related proteins
MKSGMMHIDQQLTEEMMNMATQAHRLGEPTASILKVLCKKYRFLYGEIWLPGKARDAFHLEHTWQSDKKYASFAGASKELLLEEGLGLPGLTARIKQPFVMENLQGNPRFYRSILARFVGFQAAVGIPILSDDNVMMVLVGFI